MKELVCEMCGGNNLIKKDGVYVCQTCGTKYSPEEAKKMMVEGTVSIDKSSEKGNLKTLAKRYYDNGEYEKADDYYDRIIELDPHDWEAVYYGGLASAKISSWGNLRLDEAVIGAENAIALLTPTEKNKYSKIFRNELIEVATNTYLFVMNVANENKHWGDFTFGEGDVAIYLNNLVHVAENYLRILDSFPVKKVKKDDQTWKVYMNIMECCSELEGYHRYQWGYETSNGAPVYRAFESSNYKKIGSDIRKLIVPKIKKIDPEYEEPSSSDGCYVATCVYGSYNCPEVWTLRRFRDNILKNFIFGRLFIKSYYATSPTFVKYFGDKKAFTYLFKPILDKFVKKLNNNGVESSFYIDK